MRLPLVVAALLGLLAGTAAAAAVPSYDFTKIYPTEAGFMRAIQVYQSALAANPRDADAAYSLGEAYWEASVLYREGSVPYGAGYLDKSIAALERTVSIDDKYMAAWIVLVSAYQTRGDGAKADAAARKVMDLALELGLAGRGVPRAGAHNGVVVYKYPSIDRSVKFNPANYFVVGDPDAKLVYKWPCASLPPIARPQFFLTKWEAFDRGYKPATVCRP